MRAAILNWVAREGLQIQRTSLLCPGNKTETSVPGPKGMRGRVGGDDVRGAMGGDRGYRGVSWNQPQDLDRGGLLLHPGQHGEGLVPCVIPTGVQKSTLPLS